MPFYWDPNKGSISLPGTTGQLVGIGTLTSTRDPTTTDDITQNISVGYLWFNSTAGQLRWWACRDNTASAAKWVFFGADYPNGGTTPASEASVFGSSTATLPGQGDVNNQVFGVAIAPGSTGNDNVLAVYTLPASAFDIAGRTISITASGSFGANTNNKRIKIIYAAVGGTVGSAVTGGTVIADTGTVATNGSGWVVSAYVHKYGALGANTQLGWQSKAQAAAAISTMPVPVLLTATESSAIIIAVTGNATTATPDIGLNLFQVNAAN